MRAANTPERTPLPATTHKAPPRTATAWPAVQIGTIAGRQPDGQPLVHWDDSLSHAPVPARTQIAIQATDQGRECTLAFIQGDPRQPVVLGLLHTPETDTTVPTQIISETAIRLQTGRAKLELHADGRILLQGQQICSQAYGPNQIKGASVKLN